MNLLVVHHLQAVLETAQVEITSVQISDHIIRQQLATSKARQDR